MRKKRQEERERRRHILNEINLLLALDATGWPCDIELRKAGDKLGSDEKPGYMPNDLSLEDFEKWLKIAKQNDIPAAIFKDRLRRHKTPEQAATKPYKKRSKES